MAKIQQPNGEICYTGVSCKNKHHKQYNVSLRDKSAYIPYVPDFYDKYRENLLNTNLQNYPPKTDPKHLTLSELDKIERLSVLEGVSFEEMKQFVLSSPLAWRMNMLPNVSRQSWQENALFGHLNTFMGTLFTSVEQLPKSRKESLTLLDGKIVSDSRNQRKTGKGIKSLDGKVILTNGEVIYIIAKYTHESGGAQDNQYQDATASLMEQRKDSGFKVAAILDGDYYNTPDRESNKTNIEYLRERNIPDSFAGNIEQFLDYVRSLLV